VAASISVDMQARVQIANWAYAQDIAIRSHSPGISVTRPLVEGDLAAVGHHVAAWADVLECEVYPVVDDAGAADAVKGVFGSESSRS
jgi:hypothetical protein